MLEDKEIAEAVVRPRERLSIIWLLPLVAVAIGGWLLYKSLVEAAIPVLIHFPTGQGLVAGRTEVRYQGIAVGRVERFHLDRDLDGVLAEVAFEREAEPLLREGARFWLVSPQVSLQGVSGLDTLVSGRYIALRPGDGAPRRRFEALSEPPPLAPGDPGLTIRLMADSLGSLQYGSPVHYRQLQVGDVQGYELSDDGLGVRVQVNIREEYAHLVRTNTRFWNNSGLRLRGGLSGISLKTDSLSSLLIGGISFDTPNGTGAAPPAPSQASFRLYEDYESANTGVLVRVAFESADGIEAGATPVMFRGLKVGSVVKLLFEEQIHKVVAEIRLPPEAETVLNANTRFWLVKPRLGISGISGLETLIKGNYVQLEPRPGEGGPVYRFEALPAPPVLGPGDPGLNITLTADSLGSLQYGSPVHYRQLPVGEVQGYALSDDGRQVQIHLNIRDQYAGLVKRNTRFWNNSGLRLKGNLSGIDLSTDSLASLLLGGINFDLPEGAKPGADAASGDRFPLYADAEDANAGVRIRVRFDSAEGLQAGTTPVRIRGLTVGTVAALELDRPGEGVVAVIKLIPEAERRLNDATRFWRVRPQVSLAGITGLETLLRGSHIEMAPGNGKGAPRTFTALSRPPATDADAPGLHLTLLTHEARGLSGGAPVYYRQIPVGSVRAVELDGTTGQIAVRVHIAPEYARLVTRDTRFWNAGGLQLQAGFAGVAVDAPPLKALLGGGLAFDTPEGAPQPLAANGARFTLHPGRRDAMADGLPIEISFAETRGLSADAPIRFQGIDIGHITGIALDPDTHRVRVSALIHRAHEELVRVDTAFWIVRPRLGLAATDNLETLVTGGYLRLRPGRGAPAKEFIGREREPYLVDIGSGYHYVLESPSLGSLKKGAPVYYRQVPVGRVVGFDLADDARRVLVHISIEPRFAPLIREDTRFWNVSGVDLQLNLFGGAKLDTGSVESIIAGGIALATPESENLATQAREGSHFDLYEKARPEWLKWAPQIALEAE